MSEILRRNYTVGWYSLKEKDARNGLLLSLTKRKGVKGVYIESCHPAHLEGDKGYNIQVSYQENLDETFNFPENLEKVIFLDTESYVLPYNVKKILQETQAGVVLTTPSVKDDFYDNGIMFSEKLLSLMEDAQKDDLRIVGITPSIKSVVYIYDSLTDTLNRSITSYLKNHPNIKKILIVNDENIDAYWLLKENEIPWIAREDLENHLNGKKFIK